MWWICLARADAQDDGVRLEDVVEVAPVAEARGGVLASGNGWMRTARGCLPAAITSAEPPEVVVELCRKTLEDGVLVWCTQATALRTTWSGALVTCSRTGLDGVTDTWSTAHGSSNHGPPVLVELDASHAVWRRTMRIAAELERVVFEQQVCTAESVVELGREAPPDGKRQCDRSTGLRYYVVPVGFGRSSGAGTFQAERAVDCRQPCAPNPDRERVEAETARLAAKWFSAPEGEVVGFYATKSACEAAAGGQPWTPEEPSCEREPALWPPDG